MNSSVVLHDAKIKHDRIDQTLHGMGIRCTCMFMIDFQTSIFEVMSFCCSTKARYIKNLVTCGGGFEILTVVILKSIRRPSSQYGRDNCVQMKDPRSLSDRGMQSFL